MNKKQSRKLNSLIRKECANINSDDICILFDEPTICPQLNTYNSVICKYCMESVLPYDKKLEEEIKSGTIEESVQIYHNCRNCGTSFKSSAKNSLYCEKCKSIKRRETHKKYNKESRKIR